METLGKFDAGIVEELQADARLTNVELAQRSHLKHQAARPDGANSS